MRTGPIAVKNARSSRRARVRCWATLAWRSWHIPKLLWTRTANMSSTGAMVESALPLRVGRTVFMRCRQLNLITGSAVVRYCVRRGWRYKIGLEFTRPVSSRF